eukprot:CAMPEP_0204526070 /NCGR_PEP_ID=MMETSP0661-20131031/8241_1 /ASSEMBLY_ACC=CAM_ASM_000606 /TAXON_ID=109239 /ORGANISM="Alexandrium margalefi, Strain AMGDE01CS-322" /LENGTH=353 /DNA_ID=CAMNT_0051531897 /DNA_START=34 /DNA_END=1095 /DNA_ORIENTATION=-
MAVPLPRGVLHLVLAYGALGLRRTAAPGDAVAEPPQRLPRTAILLVGIMRGWEEHIDDFMGRMVEPNKADVFLHTTDLPKDLTQRLGDSLKAVVDEDVPRWVLRKDVKQYFHLEKAWGMMEQHEARGRFKYDIVVRARSDTVPVPPSYLDLSPWRSGERDRVYMMTDRIFWSGRENMAPLCHFWTVMWDYYATRYPDPWNRTIPVWRLWDSVRRDPWITRPKGVTEDWKLYPKYASMPYPDMNKKGHMLANLQAAAEQGMVSWTPPDDPTGEKSMAWGRVLRLHRGDRWNALDYALAHPMMEKDLLHWALINNMTVCDIGASMKYLRNKGVLYLRNLSSDCSVKPLYDINQQR